MSDIKKRGLGRGLSALFGDVKSENLNEKSVLLGVETDIIAVMETI